MPFITKINLQDNRQHRLPKRESQDLSGTTVFGVPFSALTTGPDPLNSGFTTSDINITGTFSGNPTETNFTFNAYGMDIAVGELSAITPTTSAITQNTGYVFVGNDVQTIDGNTSYLNYTGVSYNLEIVTFNEISPNVYTGTTITDNLDYLSASTLDYTGRTIWSDVKGIHRTEKLIVSDGAQSNYVLTALNNEGDVVWAPAQTGNTDTNTFVETGYTNGNLLVLERNDGVDIEIDLPNSSGSVIETRFVSTWTEYIDAINDLQVLGGGFIEIVDNITITSDIVLDHSNIFVNGNNNQLITSTYPLRGISGIYLQNITFRGGNYQNSNSGNTLCVTVNSQFATVDLQNVNFDGCISPYSLPNGVDYNDPVISNLYTSSTNTNFTVNLNSCRVGDNYSERISGGINYPQRTFPIYSYYSLLINNFDFKSSQKIVNSHTTEGPNSGSNNIRLLCGTATIVNDGSINIDVDGQANGGINNGTAYIPYKDINNKDLGNISGTITLDMWEVYTHYYGTLTGNLIINFNLNRLVIGSESNFILDNPNNYELTFNYANSTTGVKYLNNINNMSASTLTFKTLCTNDDNFSVTNSTFPFILIEQVGDDSNVSGGTTQTYWVSSDSGNNSIKTPNSSHSLYGNYSIIGGGNYNTINNANYSSVSGGYGHFINSDYSFVGGGWGSYVNGSHSSAISVKGATINSEYSSIIGGRNNTITVNSSYSNIFNGFDNEIDNSSNSTIINSNNVTISNANNSIVLGCDNITALQSGTTYVNKLAIVTDLVDGDENDFLLLRNQINGEVRETEIGDLVLKRDWGTTLQRPTGIGIGYTYFDTDLGFRIDYNGTDWVDSAGVVQ